MTSTYTFGSIAREVKRRADAKPTVARIVTVLVMTDATIRVIESDGTMNGIPAVYCETDIDALDYMRDTSALSVNPAWWGVNDD